MLVLSRILAAAGASVAILDHLRVVQLEGTGGNLPKSESWRVGLEPESGVAGVSDVAPLHAVAVVCGEPPDCLSLH